MKDGGRDFTVYTFPHEEEKNIKMSISFLDADAKVVKSFEKADLKIHQNQTTYTEISIADGFGGGDDSTGGGISITVDPTWGETETGEFLRNRRLRDYGKPEGMFLFFHNAI